jgi:murein DD-endopeptidase MepM/ murein hydrolase activator NlpD
MASGSIKSTALAVAIGISLALPARPSSAAPAYGTYAWPVVGPVIRGFEPPPDPFGAGHRGIDIGAPFGSPMVAAQDGTVAFAGWVGGSLFISIDHDDGVRTTYSWISAADVRKGDSVTRGQLIGETGQGHPGSVTPHLHFGARIGATYIDPMLLLEPGSVAGLIHLAPMPGEEGPLGPDRHLPPSALPRAPPADAHF